MTNTAEEHKMVNVNDSDPIFSSCVCCRLTLQTSSSAAVCLDGAVYKRRYGFFSAQSFSCPCFSLRSWATTSVWSWLVLNGFRRTLATQTLSAGRVTSMTQPPVTLGSAGAPRWSPSMRLSFAVRPTTSSDRLCFGANLGRRTADSGRPHCLRLSRLPWQLATGDVEHLAVTLIWRRFFR